MITDYRDRCFFIGNVIILRIAHPHRGYKISPRNSDESFEDSRNYNSMFSLKAYNMNFRCLTINMGTTFKSYSSTNIHNQVRRLDRNLDANP